jgi:hypothetical protein
MSVTTSKLEPGEDTFSPTFRQKLNAWRDAIVEVQNKDRHEGVEEEGDAGGFFPVLLDEVGGSAGDASTACSFTYALLTLAGDPLDSGPFTPHWRPQTPGTLISGDGKIGMAYYDADGELALYSASETIDALVCTP